MGRGVDLPPRHASTDPHQAGVGVDLDLVVVVGMAEGTFPSTLRGVALVLKDLSSGEVFRRTILSVSGDTMTLDDVPSVLAANDHFYVGGIHSVAETKEFDAGRPSEKMLKTLELSLADCTTGAY